jgi:hypothetical protein
MHVLEMKPQIVHEIVRDAHHVLQRGQQKKTKEMKKKMHRMYLFENWPWSVFLWTRGRDNRTGDGLSLLSKLGLSGTSGSRLRRMRRSRWDRRGSRLDRGRGS